MSHVGAGSPGARSITVSERIRVFYGMSVCFTGFAVLDLHEAECCLCYFSKILLHQMPVMRGCSDTGAQKL